MVFSLSSTSSHEASEGFSTVDDVFVLRPYDLIWISPIPIFLNKDK